MHVCHVATGFLGGPEVIVRQLIEMQRASGHRVTLIYGRMHDGHEAGLDQLPADLDKFPLEAGRSISFSEDAQAYKALSDMLRMLKPDVVHIHNSKAGAIGRLVCRRQKIRNIYSPHGPAFLRRDVSRSARALYFGLEWLLCLFGDRIVASSEGELRAMRFLPARKQLIHNGVDIAAIQRKAAGPPALPHNGRLRVVMCGRIWAQKNPALVARLAAASPPDWEWVWIGAGPLQPTLDKTGRVTVLGWHKPETVLATIRTADIYVQASLWEGMPFALLEAMALGKPCVVSNVPGNRDLIRENVSGFTCKSEQDFTDALSRLADDAVLRARLGQGAADAVANQFSLKKSAQAWSSLYRQLAKDTFEDFVVPHGSS